MHQESSISVFTSISPSGTDTGSGGPSSSAVVTFFCNRDLEHMDNRFTCCCARLTDLKSELELLAWSIFEWMNESMNLRKQACTHNACRLLPPSTRPPTSVTVVKKIDSQILTWLIILQITLWLYYHLQQYQYKWQHLGLLQLTQNITQNSCRQVGTQLLPLPAAEVFDVHNTEQFWEVMNHHKC